MPLLCLMHKKVAHYHGCDHCMDGMPAMLRPGIQIGFLGDTLRARKPYNDLFLTAEEPDRLFTRYVVVNPAATVRAERYAVIEG